MATKPNSIGNGSGLNCTLSYKKDGKTKAYRLRATTLVHGLAQIASESHAPTTRAYYPHRRSQAQFMVTFVLMGRRQQKDHSEKERFNAWLKDYMDYLLEADDTADILHFPIMNVSIPTRKFLRHGIPIGPINYGEHVGSMLWMQTITFETTYEPLDTNFKTSAFDPQGTDKDRNARFFYPNSKLLSGTQKPDVYDAVTNSTYGVLGPLDQGSPDVLDVQQAITGNDVATSLLPVGHGARTVGD